MLLYGALALILLGCAPAQTRLFEDTRWAMGTSLRIAMFDATRSEAEGRALLDRAFAEVERWNALLSNYDSTSTLSQLNAAGGEWLEIPGEFCAYLERARHDSERTRGLFDISVAGFAFGGLAAVGSDGIECECGATPARARLTRPGMALDPGGDGKGVALDAVAALLREAGVRSAMLDFGGSSWTAIGRPPEAKAWRIQLADTDGELLGELALRDASLSVSATTRRGSDTALHILDPRSGELVREPRWAAVIADRATEAEVLSTALIVAGEPGLGWLMGAEQGALLRQAGNIHRVGRFELVEPAP